MYTTNIEQLQNVVAVLRTSVASVVTRRLTIASTMATNPMRSAGEVNNYLVGVADSLRSAQALVNEAINDLNLIEAIEKHPINKTDSVH